MRCKEVESLIYLYKQGELSCEEEKLRAAHLAECEKCRILYNNVVAEGATIKLSTAERGMEPASTFYREKILGLTVNNNEGEGLRQKPASYFWAIKLFAMPVYRYASAALIAGLVLAFLMQNYLVYRDIASLENKFGNPSIYEATNENKTLIIDAEDYNIIKHNSAKKIKLQKKTTVFDWQQGSRLLLTSIRKHRFFHELANQNPGVDASEIWKIYNKTVYIGESKRIQN